MMNKTLFSEERGEQNGDEECKRVKDREGKYVGERVLDTDGDCVPRANTVH